MSDEELGPVEWAVLGFIDRIVYDGCCPSDPIEFLDEHFADGTAMVGVKDEEEMRLADVGLENREEPYTMTTDTAVSQHITNLATEGAIFEARSEATELIEEHGLADAIGIKNKPPASGWSWEVKDADIPLFLICDEDGDPESVWKRVSINYAGRDILLFLDVSDEYPADNFMAMRVAMDADVC